MNGEQPIPQRNQGASLAAPPAAKKITFPMGALPALIVFLLLLAGEAAPSGKMNPAHPPPSRQPGNWQEDGSYLLKTFDRESVQSWYRDLRVGRLILPSEEEIEAMRETCLSLGAHWRPLGFLPLPERGSDAVYMMELCYYTAANPDEVAEIKCSYLGMVLLENRRSTREILCGWKRAPIARL